MSYDPSTTAILLVDPYNDFLSDGGKLWPRVKAVAEEVKLLDHLREVVSVARARGLKIVFVPHHRWEPGDYVAFDNPSPYQLAGANAQIFAKDSWGGTFHDDFRPSLAMSLSTSTGDRAALPTPISICSSSSTASVASS
jgi:nicotinamidase-related amidase